MGGVDFVMSRIGGPGHSAHGAGEVVVAYDRLFDLVAYEPGASGASPLT